MGWFKRTKNKKNDSTVPYEAGQLVKEPFIGTEKLLRSLNFKFNVYRAEGGTIVEIYPPDDNDANQSRNSKRQGPKLYIIRDEDDLGEELGKIITIETLRGH